MSVGTRQEGSRATLCMCSKGFQARHSQQARELTPEKVYEAGTTAGRLLIAVITTTLQLVNRIQSRKQTCQGIIVSHYSRASDLQEKEFLTQPGKQRQGSPKNDGKIPMRGRHSKDTNTSGKCLRCAEGVKVQEELCATDSKSGILFHSL